MNMASFMKRAGINIVCVYIILYASADAVDEACLNTVAYFVFNEVSQNAWFAIFC